MTLMMLAPSPKRHPEKEPMAKTENFEHNVGTNAKALNL